MSKCLNARLVFIRYACVLAALSCIIFAGAAHAIAQSAGASEDAPEVYGNALPGPGNALQPGEAGVLPDDWPQALGVPGMEKVTGLVRGDNNVSYAIKVLSQDAGKVDFQVKAFCVYNPESDYAILHVLDRPLMGVIDPDKKALQIDFAPLDTGLESVQTIDKADVARVLLQQPDTLVLNTVMAVQSADQSQVRFSISDMSLLQPDGTLDEFALPGPVPAVYSPDTDRFSTVAFNELTNVLQQNYVQQNTYISVVNEVNVVNMINVADFGGFGGYGLGGYGGGLPFGGYGGYGGGGGLPYGGYGGGYGGAPYGDVGGYGGGAPYSGITPYSDPLPMSAPAPISPVSVPDNVQVYHKVPVGDTAATQKDPACKAIAGKTKPIADTATGTTTGKNSAGAADKSLKAAQAGNKVPCAKATAQPAALVKAPATKAVAKTPANTQVKTPQTVQQTVKTPATKAVAKTPANTQTKTPQTIQQTVKTPATKAIAKTPANTQTKSVPAIQQTAKVPATKAVAKAPANTQVKTPQAAPQAAKIPATKAVAKAPANPQTLAKAAPAAKTIAAPKSSSAQQVAYKPAAQAVKSAPKAIAAPKTAAPQVRSAPAAARPQTAVHAAPVSRGSAGGKVASGGGRHK